MHYDIKGVDGSREIGDKWRTIGQHCLLLLGNEFAVHWSIPAGPWAGDVLVTVPALSLSAFRPPPQSLRCAGRVGGPEPSWRGLGALIGMTERNAWPDSSRAARLPCRLSPLLLFYGLFYGPYHILVLFPVGFISNRS